MIRLTKARKAEDLGKLHMAPIGVLSGDLRRDLQLPLAPGESWDTGYFLLEKLDNFNPWWCEILRTGS